jgi:hypothetical protein
LRDGRWNPKPVRNDDRPHGKITVCHANAPITIAASALAAHLAHGDDLHSTSAMGALVAELFTAKLNVAYAQQHGENLLSAVLYGRSETVEEILAEADAQVDAIADVCELDAAAVARIEWLERRLRTINAGGVVYIPSSRATNLPLLKLPLAKTAQPYNLHAPKLAPSSPYVGM